ncbi:MAG: hypothetical protein ACPG4I_04375 [Candidatus Puniceispirillaceae bacterium]
MNRETANLIGLDRLAKSLINRAVSRLPVFGFYRRHYPEIHLDSE